MLMIMSITVMQRITMLILFLWIYYDNGGDHGNDDNGGLQVQKEEVAPMPMGPPPSRKMTRTPPVYQQQVYLV